MKVIVTGATGHLGAVLVRRLLEVGHEVRAGVYGDATALNGLAMERVSLDVRDPASVRAALQGQEIVFHLAALISLRARDEPLMRAIHVDGVRNVAAAALETSMRRMIHVSSVHAYDTMQLGRPLAEGAAPATDPSCPPYDRPRSPGEAIGGMSGWCREHGLVRRRAKQGRPNPALRCLVRRIELLDPALEGLAAGYKPVVDPRTKNMGNQRRKNSGHELLGPVERVSTRQRNEALHWLRATNEGRKKLLAGRLTPTVRVPNMEVCSVTPCAAAGTG